MSVALNENGTGLRDNEAMKIRLEAAAPIIVAAELRRLATELYDGPQRWPASKVAVLRSLADDLDPEGNAT